MHRLWFGKSLIKLVVPVKDPGVPAAPGGIQGGTGYRYWTMTIHNLDEVLSAVQAAGRKIVRPRTEVRPGVVIGMVEDPDGTGLSSSKHRDQGSRPSKGYIHMSASSSEPISEAIPPDEAWLAKQAPEPILDPDVPIVDPHHHLWHRPNHRYLLDDFLADVHTGHNIVATVFEECTAATRHGPEELRSVGRNRVRRWHRSDERQRPLRSNACRRRHRGFADLTSATASSRCWKRLSGPVADGSVACAIRPAGCQRSDWQQPHGHGATMLRRSGLPSGSGLADALGLSRRLALSSPA
jgi:hypothetical protein